MEIKVSANHVTFWSGGSQLQQVKNEPISVNCKFFPRAGTAILSKHKAVSVDKTLPGHPDPNSVKDRIVTLEFDRYHVIGTYVINTGQGLKARSFIFSL
jgi:exonuclease III